MKDFRKDADAELLRLWDKLKQKGFQPIKLQFQWLMGKEKGDLLTNIRSAWKRYIGDANNFNADGSLKRKLDLFPVYLCVDTAKQKKEEMINSINFSLNYTPENGLCVTNLYMMRTYRNLDHTEIDIKHKSGALPSVRELNRLLEKTDKERIRKNVGSIAIAVDLSAKVRKIGIRR